MARSSKRVVTPDGPAPRKTRANTLEELFGLLETESADASIDKLGKYLQEGSSYHSADHAIDDTRVITSKRENEAHSYDPYGPPPWFEAPYKILRVAINGAIEEVMTHGGEELLLNLHGSDPMQYEFFWPEGLKVPWSGNPPSNPHHRITVKPGEMVRVNSSALHRSRVIVDPTTTSAWKDASGYASAWIILLSVSQSPASVLQRPKLLSLTKDAPQLVGARLLFLQSGLWEKLRTARLRSGLTAAELAQRSGLNALYIARLERLELENISLEALVRIAIETDVDILECLRSLKWVCQEFGEILGKQMNGPLTAPPTPHMLHPSVRTLGAGHKIALFPPKTPNSEFVSAIVLKGVVLAEVNKKAISTVEVGHVFHVRSRIDRSSKSYTLTAREDAELLIVRCSDRCECSPTDHLDNRGR